jgi:hypothetical protein
VYGIPILKAVNLVPFVFIAQTNVAPAEALAITVGVILPVGDTPHCFSARIPGVVGIAPLLYESKFQALREIAVAHDGGLSKSDVIFPHKAGK